MSLDLRVANFLANVRSAGLIEVFLLITLLGKLQIIFGLTVIASIIFWFLKKRRYIIYFWSALISGGLFGYLLKLFVHRDRPADPVYFEHSFSFPSGHAIFAMIFYGFLAYTLISCMKIWWRKISVFFICFTIVLVVGFSRLYLGVHYMSDVFGGFLLGFLILITTIALWVCRRIPYSVTNP